jgi:hypothetical protein
MIFIDAREGVAADMLLAAMTGLLNDVQKADIAQMLERAGQAVGLGVILQEVEDDGESGLGVSYRGERPEMCRRTRGEALSVIGEMHSAQRIPGPRSCDREIIDELFMAEAGAHEASIDEVHLHEAGRPSGLLNIFGIGVAHGMLRADGAGEIVCSPITTGRGIVVIGHGAVRVPAPASARLLAGLESSPGPDPGERATPTGLAAIRVMVSRQSGQAPSRYLKRSVGFGTRRFGGRLGRMTLYWA